MWMSIFLPMEEELVDFSEDPLAGKQIWAFPSAWGCIHPSSPSSRYDDPNSFFDKFILPHGIANLVSTLNLSQIALKLCESMHHLPSLESCPI
jgi:hypothetical protein